MRESLVSGHFSIGTTARLIITCSYCMFPKYDDIPEQRSMNTFVT